MNPFYLDHFGHRWYAIEFTDEEELEFALDNRPWYVRGQIFHMERWNIHFWDIEFISNVRVWLRIPRVPVQYRDAEILEVITPPGNFIRVDETTMYGLNGLFVRVLLEVDLRLPLERILVVNDDEECHLLLTYEKLFELCFYYGRKHFERHSCPADYDNNGCLLVDKIFEDEPLICPADFPVSEETKNELQDGVMLLFPQPTLVDEFSSAEGDVQARGDNTQEHHMEDEGWTVVPVRWARNNNKGNRIWVSRADLVSKWCPMADGGYVSGTVGGKSDAAELANVNSSKGKSVNEVIDLETGDEVFMETEDGEFEQVQLGGNRKRIRREAKGGEGPSYNLEDVD